MIVYEAYDEFQDRCFYFATKKEAVKYFEKYVNDGTLDKLFLSRPTKAILIGALNQEGCAAVRLRLGTAEGGVRFKGRWPQVY